MSGHLLIQGNARHLPLADESVQCVVTSPPYLGLRDYNVRGQIGLEATIEEYLETLVAVFREVRRVLRKDGVCWVNLGDTYATAPNGRSAAATSEAGNDDRTWRDKPGSSVYRGLKPKDLCGMPWRVALALQADGWWVRSDCIWAKKNPLPSSVKDRPALSHEYVFLLTRSERYYYDSIAVRERGTMRAQRRFTSGRGGKDAGYVPHQKPAGMTSCETRNLRTVWSLATQPLQGKSFGVDVEHFAAFPERLVEPCILAGTSAHGCCEACGAPWERVTETSYVNPGNRATNGPRSIDNRITTAGFTQRLERADTTLSWRPTCRCAAPVVPCRVLDPFIGSGTVAVVAQRHGRDCIGVDLSADYLRLAEARIQHNLNRPPRRPKRERIPPPEQTALFDI